MLSESSSLRENLILIPDADWVELQLSRGDDKKKGWGKKKRKSQEQRLPLPSVLDPPKSFVPGSSSVVLFSISAANGMKKKDIKSELMTVNESKLNANSNTNLWRSIQNSLVPRPHDAWPSWSHNSLAHFREDGYTLMYPASMRDEARLSVRKLAREFGQQVIYEFETWTPEEEDKGGGVRGRGRGPTWSDAMLRHTISTAEAPPSSSSFSSSSMARGGDEPSVVMRRVKDLPVEDELTMREWEGPPLEEVVWKDK